MSGRRPIARQRDNRRMNCRTTYKMKRAAAERFPDAEPDLQSREVRMLRTPAI